VVESVNEKKYVYQVRKSLFASELREIPGWNGFLLPSQLQYDYDLSGVSFVAIGPIKRNTEECRSAAHVKMPCTRNDVVVLGLAWCHRPLWSEIVNSPIVDHDSRFTMRTHTRPDMPATFVMNEYLSHKRHSIQH
jgi:hypothetical protein